MLALVDVDRSKAIKEVGFKTDFPKGIVAEQEGTRALVNVAGLLSVASWTVHGIRPLQRWPSRGRLRLCAAAPGSRAHGAAIFVGPLSVMPIPWCESARFSVQALSDPHG